MEAEPDENDRLPRMVVAMGLAVVAVFGVWALVAGLLLIEPKEPVISEPVAIESYPIDPEVAVWRARQAWESFVEAPDFAARVAAVRDSERVAPLMEDYHQRRGVPFPTMETISAGKPVRAGERQLVFFEVRGFDGLAYPVAMEWDDGRFGVDWESLTAYGTIAWNEFVESKPETAQTLRVYLARLPERLWPVDAENGRYFRMEHRDSPESLVVAADGPLAARLNGLTEGLRVPVTVEATWNPQSERFEILRLVTEGWSR